MNGSGWLYLLITFGLFALFAVIVIRTYRRGQRDRLEEPKYRMLDDE